MVTVHAHALFDLIDASPDGLTQEELRAKATEQLGPELSFTTCSARSMTFEEVVAFFRERNKVTVDANGKMHLARQNICAH